MNYAFEIAKLLNKNNLTLSVAESLTGGLVTSKLVSVPGISQNLFEGIVCYSNKSKMKRLGVLETTLKNFGAVSAQTALEMAVGLLDNADIVISTTGIAGPDGGSIEKPVGLVYFGLATKTYQVTYKQIFTGDRQEIREKAANFILEKLFLYMEKI